MREVKTAEHNGYTLIFTEADHSYSLIRVQAPELESVTTFVGRFFPKFETDRVATGYAKKHNLDKATLIAAWEKKAAMSTELGHSIHAFAEDTLNGVSVVEIPDPQNAKEVAYRQSTLRAISKISGKFTFIESEKMVFDPDSEKAGQIDLVLSDQLNSDIVFMDWKTNEKIVKDSSFANALPPIAHLPDCNYSKYCLQLNTYRYIAKQNNYYPGKRIRMGLVHLKEDGVDWYAIPVMETEIKEMLAYGS